MPSLDAVNCSDPEEFSRLLGPVYERSPWVAAHALTARPFRDLDELHRAMVTAVLQASREQQLALLRAHPELAGRESRAGGLTEASRREQASAGLDALTEEEQHRIERLNRMHTDRFGFPFIIAVRRYPKEQIFREFERRLQLDMEEEMKVSLEQVFLIAELRLRQVLDAKRMGRLSTHVLDTMRGGPAAAVEIELAISDPSGWRSIDRTVTNQDGRTERLLLSGEAFVPGRYRLSFAIGDYFRRTGVALPDPPFLDHVVIDFGVAESDGHYHVALLCTPWSYTTYRGS